MSFDIVIYIVIVIYSIILHEIAHGYVAFLCGDNTAKHAGRLSLNPAPHIDPVGSVIIPVSAVLMGFGVFGWAKGVPVNMANLGGSRLKEFFVSAAGIITNFIIATLFLILMKISSVSFDNSLLQNISDTLKIHSDLFFKVAIVNIGLGFFNLLPIPPFDGMGILRSIFPSLNHRFQHLEYNPASMILAILVGSYLFSFIYRDIVDFIFRIFF